MDPNLIISCLNETENLDTETNMHTGITPCEDEGRDCVNASTSQRRSKIARKPQKLEGKDFEGNRFSLTVLRRNQLC